jgi:D-xylose transport system permease protein
MVFVVSGFMAGMGGIIFTARNNANNGGNVDQSFLLLVIASAVIGGTSLFGGRGSVWSALTGALVLSSVQTGLDLWLTQVAASSSNQVLSSNVQYIEWIAEGAILLAAVLIDTFARRLATGRQT